MSEEKKGMFLDNDGNVSSKRIIGTSLAGTGGLFLLALGIASIFKNIGDPQTALETGRVLLYSGVGLLLGGVGEFFKRRPK